MNDKNLSCKEIEKLLIQYYMKNIPLNIQETINFHLKQCNGCKSRESMIDKKINLLDELSSEYYIAQKSNRLEIEDGFSQLMAKFHEHGIILEGEPSREILPNSANSDSAVNSTEEKLKKMIHLLSRNYFVNKKLMMEIVNLISRATSITKHHKSLLSNFLLDIFKPPLIPNAKIEIIATRGKVDDTIPTKLAYMNLSQISFDQNAIQMDLFIKVNPRTFDEKVSLSFTNFPLSLENHHLCLFAISKESLIVISADLNNLKVLDYISQNLENTYSKAAIVDLLIKVNGAKKTKIKKKRSKPEVCSTNFTFSLNDNFASVVLGNEECYQLLGIVL